MEANSTEQSQKGKEVFLNMVGLLGLNTEVKDKVSGRNIILSVSTDEPGRLIGRNGSSLDNVGLLMNRILKKTDTTFPKVIIDVDGYDKKSKREKRKPNNRRDKRARSAAMEKTIVLDDAPSEDKINVYVDHETDSIAPVTTVALNDSDSKSNARPQQRRGRDNRRDNNRSNNRRDNRRDNNRSNNRQRNEERAPKTETAGASSAPAQQSASSSSSAPAQQSASSSSPAPAQQSAASSSPAPAQQSAASSSPAPAQQNSSPAPVADKGGKPANKLQMQCRNTVKEVKRWGEDLLLPPLSESDCQKAIEYFSNDKEVAVQIDNSRSYGDKKRVRVSLKK